MLSTLDSRMVLDHTFPVVCLGNLSPVSTRTKQTPTLRRSLGDRRQTGPIVVLGHLIPPPSRVGERGFSQVVTQLHQLTGPITPACNRYVQYLLMGPTHRSLTDTGGGYSLEGVSFPHITLRLSQPTVLSFPPNGPAWSPV
jgi:hypothetical protein